MAALCEALKEIRRPKMSAQLKFYKLRLTDASLPRIASVLTSYQGGVTELHLSHNNLKNEGPRLFCTTDGVLHHQIKCSLR